MVFPGSQRFCTARNTINDPVNIYDRFVVQETSSVLQNRKYIFELSYNVIGVCFCSFSVLNLSYRNLFAPVVQKFSWTLLWKFH